MFSRRRSKRKKISITQETILLLVIIFCLTIFIVLAGMVFQTYRVRAAFEKDVLQIAKNNTKEVFSLDKIFLFSSANATNNSTNKAFWDLNIYQYTDIAIYIQNHSENGLSSENTIKDLWIDSISYGTFPEKGTPNLYYKNIEEFGKSSLIEENLIQDTLKFAVVDITKNEPIDTTKPTIYNTGITPITLEYVNKEIRSSAIIPNTNEPLTFDGTLLKKGNITLNSITSNLSFLIHIRNNKEEEYICNVNIPIQLEDTTNNESILNGFIRKELTNLSNYTFYKKN